MNSIYEKAFRRVEQALEDLKQGKIIMVTDDDSRENEGDLIVAAEFATAQNVNFMAVNARGLICMPLPLSRAKELGLSPMVADNTDNHETAFTVSIDHVSTGTGISAFDRSVTAMALADKNTRAADFRRPGHMFPLTARKNGVLERRGHTEATVDFCTLAGLSGAGLCCEIMSSDGTMARRPELESLASKWNMTLVTIEDLSLYRKAREMLVQKVAQALLPTKFGKFRITGYKDTVTNAEHAALVYGDLSSEKSVLCRIHSECLTGDCFSSLKCDCGEQLELAMKEIADSGCGILIYLRQEGRGIGLLNKIRAYALQDEGFDTVDANTKLGFPEDSREYYAAAHILKDLGVKKIRLMTNNPLKVSGIESYGTVTVTERVPVQVKPCMQNIFYLQTKNKRMGHLLTNV